MVQEETARKMERDPEWTEEHKSEIMCQNENNIVVLESEEKKRYYKLERMARSLSTYKGSYIITIFDCCREYVPPPSSNTRGLNNFEDEVSVPDEYSHSDTNFIIINGCAPNKTVPGYSFIAKGFFNELQKCKTASGTVLIPDFNQKFTTYRPNGEGSLNFEIAEPLLMHGPDPEIDQMPKKLLALTEKLKNLESEKEELEKRAEE